MREREREFIAERKRKRKKKKRKRRRTTRKKSHESRKKSLHWNERTEICHGIMSQVNYTDSIQTLYGRMQGE